jgi:ankyrin repeat protein
MVSANGLVLALLKWIGVSDRGRSSPAVLTSIILNPEAEIWEAIDDLDIETVRKCLAMGVDPSLSQSDGWTLLHQAIDCEADTYSCRWCENPGNPPPQPMAAIARLLLERGANVNSKDQDGLTPMDLAEEHGQPTAIALIQEYGGLRGRQGDVFAWAKLGR